MSSFYSTSEDGTLNVMDNYDTTAGSLGQELFIEVAREPNAPLMSCGLLDVREDDQVTVIDRSEVVRFRDFLNNWLALNRDAAFVIDEMIADIFDRGRTQPRPVMGGARQAPFDGEELGSFIRFAVLNEVKSVLAGVEVDYAAAHEEFASRWAGR